MMGYLLPEIALKVTMMGDKEDLKTLVSSGTTPTTMTDGSRGMGMGGSIVKSSFFESAKKAFVFSSFRGYESRDA
ncbi:hypothetical protein RRF57_008005 [Xylaria bambusicola]|uniref:Uncharacterized protein n=1 Tax=Xylaria bambusicola TaxID=326684 RepID=A0AAN7UUK0_9PEZI